MDRGPSSDLLSWLLLPVCAVLALSALGIARQPYTGLLLRDDWVAAVSNMGAPLVGQERLTDSRTIARAVGSIWAGCTQVSGASDASARDNAGAIATSARSTR